MPTNNFMEFATDPGAYVESLPDYTIDTERTAGQQSGIARADLNNRALRQGSAMAAAIGSFMVAQGYDALDDGNTAQRASDFADAVAALIQPDITAAVTAAQIAVLQKVFPVGSIYTSYNVSTSPASLLGFGTWSRIQGRMLIGASSTYSATSTGGAATHTLTVSEMPTHTHTATASSTGAHTHTATTASAGAHTHTLSGTAASAGAHTHTVTVTSSGAHTHTASTASAGAHTHTRDTMNITGSFFGENTNQGYSYSGAFYTDGSNNKKGIGSTDNDNSWTIFDASRSWTGSTSSAGAHTHTVTVTNTDSKHSHTATAASAGAHTHTVSGTAASNGAHTHTITVARAGAHTHTITVANAGSSTAFSTISPYLAVYMWRRTA